MLTYKELRDMQQAERKEKSLQKLDERFIRNMIEYFDEKRKALASGSKENKFSREFSSKVETEMNNAMRILNEIYDCREKKIIKEALINSKMDGFVPDTSNMLDFEKRLYDEAVELIGKYRKEVFDMIISGQAEVQEEAKEQAALPVVESTIIVEPAAETAQAAKKIPLLMLENVESFVWENETCGPFKKDDLVELSEEVARILIDGGKAAENKA